MPDRAFSLIEVLVASAIFAMAATVLMATFVNAVTARERSEQNEHLHEAIQTARLQLLLEPIREDAEDGGDVATLTHGEASWRASIEPTEIVDLFRVEFFVEFADPPGNDPREYTEQLFLLRPTWSEADDRAQLLEDKRDALLDSRRFRRF